MTTRSTDGPVTKAVRRAIRQARSAGLDDMGEARAAVAVDLAKKLDGGKAVMASAAIAGQLLEALASLVPEEVGNGDVLDRLGAHLSTPLFNSPN